MFIYQDIDGRGLSKKEWEEKSGKKDWIIKEYRNEKIWVRVEWAGRYDKKLPAEYRHSHQIVVLNRVTTRTTEWDEDSTTDHGYIKDPVATQSFRTRSAAMAAYEDMLIKYTNSFIDMDEDTGETTLVEEGNEFGPKTGPVKFEVDDELLEIAEQKGISVGGWS